MQSYFSLTIEAIKLLTFFHLKTFRFKQQKKNKQAQGHQLPRVILLCVFTFCDVRYYSRMKTMFDSSLPAVVCKRVHVLFTIFVLVCVERYPTHSALCCVLFFSVFWFPLRWSLTFIYQPVSNIHRLVVAIIW